MQKLFPFLIGCFVLCTSSCKMPSAQGDEFYIPVSTTELRIVTIDGYNEHALTNDQKSVLFANYLPNGERIIFVQSDGYSQTMYSMLPDGTERLPIVKRGIIQLASLAEGDTGHHVLFSPDSRKIYYTAGEANGRGYSMNIYSINVDGSNETNLTNSTDAHIGINSIAISADGQQIAYCEYNLDTAGQVSMGERRICIIRTDGSNKRIVKKFFSTEPLFPQFLPTDVNTLVYLERSMSDSNIGWIKKIALSDTSIQSTIASLPRIWQFPTIIGEREMMFNSMTDINMFTIDLLSGEQSSFPVSYCYEVNPSRDGAMLAFGHKNNYLSISQQDGAGLKKIESNLPKSTIIQPFISPNKQWIIFRAKITVERKL